MGRFYSLPFGPIAVSAAVDVFEIVAVTGKPFWLHEVVIGQVSDYGNDQAEGLCVTLKRATAGYTAGSGGVTLAPGNHLPNDTGTSATAKACNTTQAVAGSGTLITLRNEPWNVQGGYLYTPDEKARYFFSGGQVAIVSQTIPADAITLYGTAVIEELG